VTSEYFPRNVAGANLLVRKGISFKSDIDCCDIILVSDIVGLIVGGIVDSIGTIDGRIGVGLTSDNVCC
jgi:hypothetical protein